MRKYLHNVWKRVEAYQTRRANYWQLHHLSDAQLKDIGVSRSEILWRIRN